MSGNAPPRAVIVFISVIFVAYALFVFWRATSDFQPVNTILAFVATSSLYVYKYFKSGSDDT